MPEIQAFLEAEVGDLLGMYLSVKVLDSIPSTIKEGEGYKQKQTCTEARPMEKMATCPQKQTGGCGHKLRCAGAAGAGRGRVSYLEPPEHEGQHQALSTPCFQTSGPQDRGHISVTQAIQSVALHHSSYRKWRQEVAVLSQGARRGGQPCSPSV